MFCVIYAFIYLRTRIAVGLSQGADPHEVVLVKSAVRGASMQTDTTWDYHIQNYYYDHDACLFFGAQVRELLRVAQTWRQLPEDNPKYKTLRRNQAVRYTTTESLSPELAPEYVNM